MKKENSLKLDELYPDMFTFSIRGYEHNKFEVFYIGEPNSEKDNKIKEYVNKLFKDAYNIDAQFTYEDITYGIRKGLQWRWLGWNLNKELTKEQRTTTAISIATYLNGVLISQI